MKSRIFILLIIFSSVLETGLSQGQSRKELNQQRTLEKQKQVDSLVNSREFVFIARIAMPTGMSSVNLSSNPNYVKFQPDLIDSYMPFFGTAYSGVGYGTDTGLKFKGKPELFKVEKNKNTYQIDAVVKGETDNFRLSLSVGFWGSASLTITTNNRSIISYIGEISSPEKPKDKQ